MTETTFDTIVIGAGQAGPVLANTLAKRGETVALIEADRFGGTCLNTGCRPTKALRASARAAHVARSSGALGVTATDVRVDLSAIVDRKDTLVSGWRENYETFFDNHDRIEYVRGFGVLNGTNADGSHAVLVGDRALSARRIVLNTGTRSVPPPIDGLDSVPWLDHVSLLDLHELPTHLIVLGGSYIGLELGQIFARFGSEVTIIERGSRLVTREDPDVSSSMREFLEAEGIRIIVDRSIVSTSSTDGELSVHLGQETITGSHLLIAAGRVPNSDKLGLETVGIETDSRGFIQTDDVFATNVDGIYALGDINGRGAFTHTAYQDFEILADHLDGGSRSAAHRVVTYAVFTDPPLGRVGLTETAAREAGVNLSVASYPMNQVTRAVLDGETDGHIKLLVDTDTGLFVGAHALGMHGDEIIQTISALMHAEVPASIFSTWLPVHPTMAEFFPTIMSGLEAT